MAEALIEYRDEDTDVVFRWHGGAYVDVGYVRAGGFEAQDVLNVWDDEQDVSELEKVAADFPRPFRRILELFEDRCREYLALDEDEGGGVSV